MVYGRVDHLRFIHFRSQEKIVHLMRHLSLQCETVRRKIEKFQFGKIVHRLLDQILSSVIIIV